MKDILDGKLNLRMQFKDLVINLPVNETIDSDMVVIAMKNLKMYKREYVFFHYTHFTFWTRFLEDFEYLLS